MKKHKIKVVFICVHNSARSQIAEAYLKSIGKDMFEVQSAGLEPTQINPFVVEAMKEEGIDLSKKQTQSVFKLFQQGALFDYVITVCRDSEIKCPVFPGITKRLNWAFEDPESFHGNNDEILKQVKKLRDRIKVKIQEWIIQVKI
ncbi:Arsenate reductase [Desulfonema limicola]|uniref:Arsenate reductase n=1 Tax=Desulfonema limicola TaxID=45656 RepID=A0A975BEA9_9BACT|nr:arsenate reductase ArsC [Desulfonema limicola]QTA83574.1 Arsenate reductase [Desulfonema limicola]